MIAIVSTITTLATNIRSPTNSFPTSSSADDCYRVNYHNPLKQYPTSHKLVSHKSKHRQSVSHQLSQPTRVVCKFPLFNSEKANDATTSETATCLAVKRSHCQIILPLLRKSDCNIMVKSSYHGSDKFSIRHLPAHSFTVGGHCKSDNQIMGLPNLSFFVKFSAHSDLIHRPHGAPACFQPTCSQLYNHASGSACALCWANPSQFSLLSTWQYSKLSPFRWLLRLILYRPPLPLLAFPFTASSIAQQRFNSSPTPTITTQTSLLPSCIAVPDGKHLFSLPLQLRPIIPPSFSFPHLIFKHLSIILQASLHSPQPQLSILPKRFSQLFSAPPLRTSTHAHQPSSDLSIRQCFPR